MLEGGSFTLGEAAPACGVGSDAGSQPGSRHRAVQRHERLQTRQRRRYKRPETGRMNKSSDFQDSRPPWSLGARTQLNVENRQGIQGGVVRDLRMRGGAAGDIAARNGLAIVDLDRSAADLAATAAAAAERHKDAMVSIEDGAGRKGSRVSASLPSAKPN